MSKRKDFIVWSETAIKKINEALPDPEENPPYETGKGSGGFWTNFLSSLRGKPGPVDPKDHYRQAHIDAWERKRQQQFKYGDPDDPKVKQQKADRFTSILEKEIERSLPGADKKTISAAKSIARPFAEMLTQGKPIIPMPLLTPVYDGKSVMALVHEDPGLGEPIKGTNAPWAKPFNVFRDIILQTFNSSPKVWYEPTASSSEKRYPPGATPDKEAWLLADQRWLTKGTGQQRREFGKEDLLNTLQERGIKEKDLNPDSLDRMIHGIIKKAKEEGNFVTIDEVDLRNIKTRFAADVTENVFDILYLRYGDNARGAMTKRIIDNQIKSISNYLKKMGKNPVVDLSAIYEFFLKTRNQPEEGPYDDTYPGPFGD